MGPARLERATSGSGGKYPPAILYFACCATWREAIKSCMEQILRIYAGTWP